MKTADWIIDADTHVTEPPDLWTSRLPAKYADQAPRVVMNERRRCQVWEIGGVQALLPLGSTAVAGLSDPSRDFPRVFEDVDPAAYDAGARLRYMDSVGVWAAVIYPNVGGFGNAEFLQLKDPELQLACVRAYNDFLSDWTRADPRRLIAVTALPFWDVEASVEEIERCAAKGHKGVLFPGAPQDFGQPRLAERHWDRLWAAAQAHELPVSFHVGSGDPGDVFNPARLRAYGRGAVETMTSVWSFLENGKQLTDLLMSGILPRFPTLRFISVESGIGFVPFVLEGCDHLFERTNVRKQSPEYQLKPSEYFARQVSACYFFETVAPQHQIEDIGVDNILYETDFPHTLCQQGAEMRRGVEAGLRGKSQAVRSKLLWENSAALYKIDAPDRPAPSLDF